MTRKNRALAALMLVTLLSPNFSRVAQAQSGQPQQDSRKTVTISGTTGVGGVTLKGLPSECISDSDGKFSVEVSNANVSGYVMPIKEGYTFDPPFVSFNTNAGGCTVFFTARVATFTISGSVGLPGVRMTGLPDNRVTDSKGEYKATVPYGWAGKVLPSKPGYVFNPVSRQYSRITENKGNEDYASQVVTFKIAGNAGAAEVRMTGLPGDVVTDSEGNYAVTVEYGWSGMVLPEKRGYEFDPPSREYMKITADFPREDYRAQPIMLTITDMITTEANNGLYPVRGVRVTAKPGGQSVITGHNGRYTIEVPYGWTGELVMDKAGFDFSPASVKYTNVTENIDTTASNGPWPAMPYSRGIEVSPADNVLVVPTAGVEPEAFGQIAEDMRVMLNILRDKLRRPRMISGVLQDYGDFFDDSDHAVQALYIQGHGAVFMLKADFPFAIPAQPQNRGEAPAQEAVDPVWQRARQRLYAPPDAAAYGVAGASGQASGRSFDQFKSDLLQTLRHAANIRHIDPNEWVIVTVTGRGDATLPGAGGGMSSASPGVPRRARSIAAPVPTTVLTLQARKADIDAFAKGDIAAAAFEERVKAFTY